MVASRRDFFHAIEGPAAFPALVAHDGSNRYDGTIRFGEACPYHNPIRGNRVGADEDDARRSVIARLMTVIEERKQAAARAGSYTTSACWTAAWRPSTRQSS